MLDCPEAGSLLQATEVLDNISDLSCPVVYSNFLDSPRPISSEGKEAVENHFLPPLTCSHQVQGSREHHIMRSKEDTAGWPLSRAQLPGLL